MSNCYVDVHVIQTLPPSCVNRDDTGSPKTAVYGGVTRARVSSQAWKHAMRENFLTLFDKEYLGFRTKRILEIVSEKIKMKNPGLDEKKLAENVQKMLEEAGFKFKNGISEVLFFMSDQQAEALGELYEKKPADKKEYKNRLQKALRENPSVDIALFGRMVASDPTLNVDACAQVAHAISTHKVQTEFDYFTAVDDCAPEDNAGAGHLGTVEYNSATMYRYATINVCELADKLRETTAEVVEKFVKAFALSMPTGKQNTFANRTVPDMIYVTLRDDQPVNLCGAFEKAIVSKEGYVEQTERQLLSYAKSVYTSFVEMPKKEYYTGGEALVLEDRKSFKELLACLKNDIEEYLQAR